MSSEIKEKVIIDKEDLEKLRESSRLYQEKIQEIGTTRAEEISIQYRLTQIEEKLIILKKDYLALLKNEADLANKLKEKYGRGTINPQTGEFTLIK
tara:strand:+ start:208 stop:495 length:288 start_codon:yes stop_codon:yes gene_type:complete